MGAAVQFAVNFAQEECCNCGIVFFVPRYYQQRRREQHDRFYCPNGHGQFYRVKSEADELRELLAKNQAALECARANAQMAENSRRVIAGHLTRVRKRVAGGACPCCNRSFQNLARHMKVKHPTYGEEPSA